jgi:hypothetical protein
LLSGAAVQHLYQAPAAVDVRDQLVPAAGTRVEQHIRASLGDGEQQIVDTGLIDAETGERVTEHPAHHRDAQRLPRQYQAELNVCGWSAGMDCPRSHPFLSPVTGNSQFTL